MMLPIGELFKNQLVGGGLILMVTGAVMALLRQVPDKIYAWIRRSVTMSVTITDKDPLFEWAKLWLDSLPYAKKARRITCSLYREAGEDFSTESRVLFTPARGAHFFRHNGRFISLSFDKPETPSNNATTKSAMQMMESLTFTVFGIRQKGIRDLIVEISNFAAENERNRPQAYISGYGWWRRLPSFMPRRLDTVDLPPEDEKRILEAIQEFRKSRALYAARGIPYHLNFLFEGPPGTGKTSTASAICGYFGLNLHLLNIAGPGMNDDRLVDLMLSLPRNTMLLMEDVDATVPERKTKPKATPSDNTPADGASGKADEQSGVTLSGLLNCMDGITAPDGAIIVMTTNHPELLDPAMLRKGRMDIRIPFKPATEEQIVKMSSRLLPSHKLNGEAHQMIEKGYTTAQVQAELLETFDKIRKQAIQ